MSLEFNTKGRFSDNKSLEWNVRRKDPYIYDNITEQTTPYSATSKYGKAIFSQETIRLILKADIFEWIMELDGPVTVNDLVKTMRKFYQHKPNKKEREEFLRSINLSDWNPYWFKTIEDVNDYVGQFAAINGDHVYFEGFKRVDDAQSGVPTYKIIFGS